MKNELIGSDTGISEILTGREIEVVCLLAKGFNAEEIADKLDISFNTIRTHKKNMLKKTGCRNATELVAKSLRQGVI